MSSIFANNPSSSNPPPPPTAASNVKLGNVDTPPQTETAATVATGELATQSNESCAQTLSMLVKVVAKIVEAYSASGGAALYAIGDRLAAESASAGTQAINNPQGQAPATPQNTSSPVVVPSQPQLQDVPVQPDSGTGTPRQFIA